MDLHSLISSGSYLAIFILMIANGIVNFPSSQILYLIVGYFVSTGDLTFTGALIAGALGNTIGNTITYMLVKKYDKPFAQKLLMLDTATFTKLHAALHDTFSRRGMWWIFLGKLTPSIKAFIPVVAGLAATPRNATMSIFALASTLWACGIIYLGYAFGENVSLSSFLFVSLIIGVSMMLIVYKKVLRTI